MAKQPDKRIYEASPERLYEAVRRVVSELRYSVTHSDPDALAISFNTGMSLWSWSGQNMTAAVFALPEGRAKVVIGGRTDQRGNPVAGGGGQLYSWGESGKIAKKVFGRLQPVLADTPEPLARTSESVAPFMTEELERLADLHAKGVLDDAEFNAAKARLLS